jgi:hypothetical protein
MVSRPAMLVTRSVTTTLPCGIPTNSATPQRAMLLYTERNGGGTMGFGATTMRIRLCVNLSATVLMILPRLAFAAPRDELLSHVPKSACFVVYTDDAAAAATAFTATRLGDALSGSDFDPLRAELLKANRATALQLRPAFGLGWSDVAGANTAAALVAVPLPDHSLGWVFLFALPAHGGALPSPLVAAERSLLGQGFQRHLSPRNSVPMWIFTPPLWRPVEADRAIFAADSVCGVASNATAAEAVLNAAANTSLASESDFQATRIANTAPAGDAAVVRLFVRPLEFAEAARGRAIDPKPSAKDRLAAARRLGFGDIRAIGFNFDLAPQGACEWQLEARVLARKPFHKAMRLLSMSAGHLPELPAWLEDSFSSVWQFRMDFVAAMQGYGNLYDEANEPGPDGEGLFDDVLNGLRDDPEGVRVDLRKDLFAVLGPEAIRVNYDGNWLYSVAMQDAPRVLSALMRFYKGDKRVKHEATTRYELWTVGPGASLFVEGQGSSNLSIRGIAVSGNQLLLSLDPDRLKAALESQIEASPVAKDADWKTLGEWLDKQSNAQTAARGLLQMDRLVEGSYRKAIQAKPPTDSNLLTDVWRALLFGTASQSPELPYTAAPSFDRLRAAFPRGGATVSTLDDGLTIRLGALRHVNGN